MLCRFPSWLLFILVAARALANPPQPTELTCPEALALIVDGAAEQHVKAARWLHGQRPLLHISKPVEEVIEALAQSQGGRLQKPADKIARWLEYMRLAMDTDRLRDKVRAAFLETNVLTPDQVPESHFELQRRIARELGHGDAPLTPEMRQELGRAVVESQRESLGAWWDYLSSNDAKQYPAWARVFVLGEVARIGRFDAETGKFTRRDKDTVASFPELNQEALAKVISELEEHAQRGDRQTFSFSESYGRKLTEAIKESGDPSETDGQWVKYPKGSSPEKLSSALEGWNTGWCTSDCGTAARQLRAGDFYVYFTVDRNGLPRVPRLAIRMHDDSIAEVRGIAKEQNVDSHMAGTAVLDQKLSEFGAQAELYRKRSRQMRQLTGLESKLRRKEELSPQELWFLYEMDGPIEGFGYGKDPRVAKIRGERNAKAREDFATLLAFFAGSRGKKLTEVQAESYARENAVAIVKALGARRGWPGRPAAIDLPTAFNQFKEILSSPNFGKAASVLHLVSDSMVVGDFRRVLAEDYVAKTDPVRLARDVVRHWSVDDEITRQFAIEVLDLGGHQTIEIPMMRAFNEIETISQSTNVSHRTASEKWLSDPSGSIELKVEFLRAHVTSSNYEALEARLPKGEREQVRRELSRRTTALTFRKLAKRLGFSHDYFAELTLESFDKINFEFPNGGKKITLGGPEERGIYEHERQREVTLTKPFWLQATDVTNAQYRIYLEVTGANPEKLSEIRKTDPNEPVVAVSWNDAVAYAKWFASIDPTHARLPTEAEWEYAARAGTTTRYWSGDSVEDLLEVGWGYDNSGGRIHPVALKRPNPNGLYDVHGNNWKWMQDAFQSDLSNLATDPLAEKGSDRVLRGGSWANGARYLHSAYRDSGDPGDRSIYNGFRLAGTPR